MEENGIYIALISVNLCFVGVLSTILIIRYFFFNERLDDIKMKIEEELETLQSSLLKGEESFFEKKHEEAQTSIEILKKSMSERKYEQIQDEDIILMLKIFEHFHLATASMYINKEINFKEIFNLNRSNLDLLYIVKNKLKQLEMMIFEHSLHPKMEKTIEYYILNCPTVKLSILQEKHNAKKIMQLAKENIKKTEEAYNILRKLFRQYEVYKNYSKRNKLIPIFLFIVFQFFIGICFPLLMINIFPFNNKVILSTPSIGNITNFSIGYLLAITSLTAYSILLGYTGTTLFKRHTTDTLDS